MRKQPIACRQPRKIPIASNIVDMIAMIVDGDAIEPTLDFPNLCPYKVYTWCLPKLDKVQLICASPYLRKTLALHLVGIPTIATLLEIFLQLPFCFLHMK